jgi:serine/threonine protein kinase
MAKIYGNRWEIVEPLGQGGQAHTYLVKDLKGEGNVLYALKRLIDTNRIDRFKREIETIRNLTHENILRLIDFDLDAEKPYLVSEYCAGKSLSQAEPFWHKSPVKALGVFRQICEGMAYAHNQGVIHRDLKPDNIFLRTKEGPAVVGDFGICYLEDSRTRLTTTDRAVGPRLFMAPELEDGRDEDISPKCDTYSLGKLLYWLLSDGRVFSREKHRQPGWDLKGQNIDSPLGWNNIYMEHVNRLLDLMIVHNKDERRSVRNILGLLPRVTRFVEKEFNPIAKDITQPCIYCGYGQYVIRAENYTQVSNFGFNLVGDPDWRIFVCDHCGHVQTFRVDMADKKQWWS